MYVLGNGHNYIGLGGDNVATCVTNIKKALSFSSEKKAKNYNDNLKSTLRKFGWQVLKIEDDNNAEVDEVVEDDVAEHDDYVYKETELERAGFDISEFFNKTIETISQLRDYANNMRFLEQECNKKILDTRHYKRDIRTKLSAVQLQRLAQFEIQLERERYEYKSNRIIAEIFLSDIKRVENIKYIETIKNVKESEYKPEILTYDLLDEIVGKKKVNRNKEA